MVICFFLVGVLILVPYKSTSYAAPVITPLGQYALPDGSPARIATGSDGKLYVTSLSRGLVAIYSNNGLLLSGMRSLKSPLGIAVDDFGNMYISDVKKNSVGVYTGAGELLYELGAGDGEFGLPNDIAVSHFGRVYVTDSTAHVVKVYSTAGSYLSSFGAGLLSYPTGIAVYDADGETNGEVFVIDLNNNNIRVYDLNGTLKRSIRGGGGMMGGGALLRPLGLAVDNSNLYVADAFYSIVAVFDKNSGVKTASIGTYGSGSNEYKTPIDLVIDPDNKMFITNYGNNRLEVLGLDSFSGLQIEPSSLSFTVYQGGEPVTHSIQVSAIGTDVSWTAVASHPLLSLSATSGTTPAMVDVTVTPGNVSLGIYNEEITFITASGTEAVLPVVVEVKKPELFVSPQSLSFVYQLKSDVIPTDSVLITATATGISWNAFSSSPLLTIDKTAGITPDSLHVSFADAIRNLAPGDYDTQITVDAGDVIGSPAVITVHLTVIKKGKIRVQTNLADAVFSIAGPERFTGTGTDWTAENAPEGSYSITFSHVSGYRKPLAQSFTITTGAVTEVTGIYTKKSLATHLVAGSNDPSGGILRILTIEGVPVLTLVPFDNPSVVKVATGDLDGDGIDEIIVTNGKNIIKVFSADGLEIASHTFNLIGAFANLEITTADIDQDGKAEILAAFKGFIMAFRLNRNTIEAYRYIMYGGETVTLAAGDVNGDGRKEMLVASNSEIRAYTMNPAKILWSRPLQEQTAIKRFDTMNPYMFIWNSLPEKQGIPHIAAGDLNDDGIDEVCIASGSAPANVPAVRCLQGDGTDNGIAFDAFGEYNYAHGASVALGDFDGEGRDELAAGAGPHPVNEPLITIFDADSPFIVRTIQAFGGFYGVNVSFGRFGRE